MKLILTLTLLLGLQATAATKISLNESDKCFPAAVSAGLNRLNKEARRNKAHWVRYGYDFDRCTWESHHGMIECWNGDRVEFEMVLGENSSVEKVTPTLKRKWFEFIFDEQGRDLILEVMFEETPSKPCQYNHSDLTSLDDGEE